MQEEPTMAGRTVSDASRCNNAETVAVARPAWTRQARFYLAASRPGLYLPTVWFYLLTVGRQPSVFHQWTFWVGLFYFMFPFNFLLYGWNDLGDVASDRQNPRKGGYLWGPVGAEQELARLPIALVFVQLPFVGLFTYQEGPRFLVWFAVLLLANVLYNSPPFRFKGRAPLELLNQNGYLLVFVLSSWLNDVPQLPTATFLFGSLFAMHSHLFGEIMDYIPDRTVGRRTTTVVLGIRPAKWLLVGFLVAESALFWFTLHHLPLAGFFLTAASWFVLDVLFLWRERPYTAEQMRGFGYGVIAASLVSIPYMWWTGVMIRPR